MTRHQFLEEALVPSVLGRRLPLLFATCPILPPPRCLSPITSLCWQRSCKKSDFLVCVCLSHQTRSSWGHGGILNCWPVRPGLAECLHLSHPKRASWVCTPFS